MSDATPGWLLAPGHVTEWHSELGWGVVELDVDGLRVWTHFSVILVPANVHRDLHEGEQVLCSYETPGQDGYPARALAVRRSAPR